MYIFIYTLDILYIYDEQCNTNMVQETLQLSELHTRLIHYINISCLYIICIYLYIHYIYYTYMMNSVIRTWYKKPFNTLNYTQEQAVSCFIN